MIYLWIFLACWGVGAVVIFTREGRKNSFAANRLREFGASERGVASFQGHVTTPKMLLLKVWASFFFGSVVGAIVSLVYWLLK